MNARSLVPFSLICLVACAKQGDGSPNDDSSKADSPSPSAAPAATAEAKPTEAKPTEAPADPHAGLARLEVDEVARLIGDGKIVAVDSNGQDTREKYGTLPGAVLLSNARTYPLSELPEDKSSELVFYCGSAKCSSAPKAAARAEAAGYTAVKVMPAGIRGWVEAGKPVEQS